MHRAAAVPSLAGLSSLERSPADMAAEAEDSVHRRALPGADGGAAAGSLRARAGVTLYVGDSVEEASNGFSSPAKENMGGQHRPSGGQKTPTLNLVAVTRNSSAQKDDALDSTRRRAGAASAAAARLAGGSADYADPETSVFTYHQVRDRWGEHKINPTCKELYLVDDEFTRLFGMAKNEFYALRQWQQRDMKQRLQLF